MNRDVQRIMDGESYRRLFPGTQLFGKNVRTLASGTWMRNSDFFEVVGKRGSYRSTGVGGGITGMGADLICIDDPIKSAAEARSSTLRTGQWEWFNSDLYTRQQPGCRILLTLTRWHNDDIAGRLLEQAREGGEPWTVLRLPAIAEDTPSHPDDPRSPGEALWPDRFGLEWLERARQQLGPFGWGSLYQQNPTPREGGLFRPGRFILVPCGPAGNGIERVRAWDKGYSSQGDFTAGVLLARTPDGFWWVEDVVRGRWSPGERNEIIRQTAWDDARRYDHGVKTLIERPPGAGTETTDALVRELAGVSVEAVNPRGSKEERAEPAAAMVEGGNVKLVMGKWNRLFLDELAAFPGGENDDQADAFATGFNWLAERLLGGFEQGNHAARQAELGSRVDELFGRE
jgi:predicted phage terminase large subunit-like protein